MMHLEKLDIKAFRQPQNKSIPRGHYIVICPAQELDGRKFEAASKNPHSFVK